MLISLFLGAFLAGAFAGASAGFFAGAFLAGAFGASSSEGITWVRSRSEADSSGADFPFPGLAPEQFER